MCCVLSRCVGKNDENDGRVFMSGLVIFGTRPEAIKLAPVVAGLRAARSLPDFEVICTGQHAEIMTQTLKALDLKVDANLHLMQPDQTPIQVVRRIIDGLSERYSSKSPDWVLVQGDTATAFAGAEFGYLSEASVVHLEAGLRTHDINEPWPEEGFRQEIARLASLHLAPYPSAQRNLLDEGIDADSIHVVGNTGLDSQELMLGRLDAEDDAWLPDGEFILVTLHRRENLGERLAMTCQRLASLLTEYPDMRILWPIHPNPKVRHTAYQFFGKKNDRVTLCEPLDYPKFLSAQKAARLVVSDSGGVQEEAASMGTRVAIVREKTERPDAVDLDLTRIVGADSAQLSETVADFLANPLDPQAVDKWRFLQGEGQAGSRAAGVIVERIARD
jgi:UDP-N-acetylglucosamine 2-epimerase (non-hydrolysing)